MNPWRLAWAVVVVLPLDRNVVKSHRPWSTMGTTSRPVARRHAYNTLPITNAKTICWIVAPTDCPNRMLSAWSIPNRSEVQNHTPTSPIPPRKAVRSSPRVSTSSAMPTKRVPTSSHTMNEESRLPQSAVTSPATTATAMKAGISSVHRGARSSSRNTGRHHPKKYVMRSRAKAPTPTGNTIAFITLLVVSPTAS